MAQNPELPLVNAIRRVTFRLDNHSVSVDSTDHDNPSPTDHAHHPATSSTPSVAIDVDSSPTALYYVNHNYVDDETSDYASTSFSSPYYSRDDSIDVDSGDNDNDEAAAATARRTKYSFAPPSYNEALCTSLTSVETEVPLTPTIPDTPETRRKSLYDQPDEMTLKSRHSIDAMARNPRLVRQYPVLDEYSVDGGTGRHWFCGRCRPTRGELICWTIAFLVTLLFTVGLIVYALATPVETPV